MYDLSEVKPATRIKGLHVGRSGGGKTVAAASIARLCPPGERVYIFDNDGRMRPIVKMFPDLPKGLIQADSYGPHDFEKLYDKTCWLLDHPDQFWAIILDGLSMLADMTIDYSIVLNKGGQGRSDKMKKGVLDMPEMQDYKAEMRGISTILDNLRSFPRHFIMTAHIMQVEYKVMNKTTKTEENKIERLLVTAGRKIAPKIPIYFDEVYLFKPEVSGMMGGLPEYQAFTVPNEEFVECRSALSLPAVINWTMKPGDPGFYPSVMKEVEKMNPEYVRTLLEK